MEGSGGAVWDADYNIFLCFFVVLHTFKVTWV